MGSNRPQTGRRFRPQLCPLEARVVPAAGEIDTSFDVDGRQTVSFDRQGDEFFGSANHDEARDLVVQPDGKIVLAGIATVGDPAVALRTVFAVTRLNADGSPDLNFGQGGRVTIDFDANESSEAHAVTLTPDGEIVVVGSVNVLTDTPFGFRLEPDFAVARLTKDGVLDNSFDNDGMQTIAFNRGGSRVADIAYAVAVQPDRKIVVAGVADTLGGEGFPEFGTNQDFAVVRLNPNGSLDDTFGPDAGKFVFGFDLSGQQVDVGRAVALMPGGRIAVAGSAEVTRTDAVISQNFAVAVLTSTGALDGNFSGDGRQTVAFDQFGNFNDAATDVTPLADGSLVLAGDVETGDGGRTDFGVVRLQPNGTPDGAFGTGGRAVVPVLAGAAARAGSVAVQADGKILVGGGYSAGGNDTGFAVVRLTTTGTKDPGFNGTGTQTGKYATQGNGGPAIKMTMQGDGKILLGGYNVKEIGNGDFAVVRLLGDPPAPPPPPNGNGGTTAAPPRAVAAILGKVGGGKKKRLGVRILYTAGTAREVVSPFQKPIYQAIRAELQDFNHDGVMDSVLFTAKKGTRKVRRLVLL